MKKFTTLLLIVLCSIVSVAQTDYYMYVSDAGGFNAPPWQVLRYDLDGQNPQVFISSQVFEDQNVGWPQDIIFLEDQGVALVSCLVGNRITRHNINTGAYIDDFAAVPQGPTRMKIGADDLIYVAQWAPNTDSTVLRYEQDGTLVDEFTSTGIPNGIGIDWDTDGNFYVSSFGLSQVRQFDANGDEVGVFINNTNLSGPTNIHREVDGNFLVLNWSGGTIQRFSDTGSFIETFTTEVTQPEGIAEHPISSNYIVGNGGPARIDEFAPDGTYVGPIVPDGFGGLIQPNAVVIRNAPLSVEDKSEKKIIITPTIGSNFKILNTELNAIDSFEVRNIQGQIVARFSAKDSYWNAQALAEGIYFVRSAENGRLLQKIIVKK